MALLCSTTITKRFEKRFNLVSYHVRVWISTWNLSHSTCTLFWCFTWLLNLTKFISHNIVKRKQRRPLENVWPVQNRVMLKIQGYLKIASLSKVFLRNTRQPEVRPSAFLYGLTLPNLYCLVSLLLWETICPKVWTKQPLKEAETPLPVVKNAVVP